MDDVVVVSDVLVVVEVVDSPPGLVVVVTVASVVLLVVGQDPSRRGSQRSTTASLSFFGLPAVRTVSRSRLVRGLVRRSPLRGTSSLATGPQTASASRPVGTGSAAPATFAGLRSACGVQPGTLVWFRQTAISNVQTPWHSPSMSQAGSPSVHTTRAEPSAPRTSSSP
jgi:hypothetical protein